MERTEESDELEPDQGAERDEVNLAHLFDHLDIIGGSDLERQ